MTPFAVAPLRANDRQAWETLARAYHAFYGEQFPPDAYDRVWDGRDEGGATQASGVYFARVQGQGITGTRKLLVVH